MKTTTKTNNDTLILLISLAGAGAVLWALWPKISQAGTNPGLPPVTPPIPPVTPPFPPTTTPGTTPGTPPTGTTPGTTPPIGRQAQLAQAMVNNLASIQAQYGPKASKGKENRTFVKSFQQGEGLKDDGLAGPGTLLRAAQYVQRLPLVQYWPKGANQSTVAKYKADLNAIASGLDPARATELRASAQRERGQAGVG